MITTSRSAVSAYQACPRKRYLGYEAANGTDTPGWERRKHALPLATGIYVHEGLEKLLGGASATSAAEDAQASYRAEVEARGLAVEDGTDEALVIEEQAAHVQALVLAWARVRWPRWQDEYELVEVEQEDRVALSDDVTLACRSDAIVRRKLDGRLFIINFKTVGQADDRWLRQWEVDMQLMTELLAAEHRYGQEFGGVIIEGLVKGARVAVDQWLKEVRGDDAKDRVALYIDRSRLLYGYKCDANPPLTPLQYAWEGTTKKGWYKFRTWREDFWQQGLSTATQKMSSLEYWINWLPEEVVESQFVVVPPIYRDRLRIDSKVRQITAMERRIAEGVERLQLEPHSKPELLDEYFPTNEHSCTYPSRCAMYEACYEGNVAEDMLGSGLYLPRVDHHKIKEGE